MSNHEGQPVDPWRDDRLNRKQEAKLVLDYMLRRLEAQTAQRKPRSFVLNIDAPWGSGKSFFLRMLQDQMESDGYLVAYVNAWEHDHGEDAMLPILSSIKIQLEKALPEKGRAYAQTALRAGAKVAMHVAKGAANQIAKRYLGEDLAKLSSEVATAATDAANETIGLLADAAINEIEERVKLIGDFRGQLARVVSNMGSEEPNKRQLFIFIDELDRCRPTYAIETLERVKHIFNIDGAAFVLATDTAQLQHSINKVYGQNFDPDKYLRRFFDRQYQLAKSEPLEIVRGIITSWKIDNLSWPPNAGGLPEFLTKLTNEFELSPRDLIQCLMSVEDIVITWELKSKVELSFLVPLAILYHCHKKVFDAVASNTLSANDQKLLYKFLSWEVPPASRNHNDETSPVSRFIVIFNAFDHASRDNIYDIAFRANTHHDEAQRWANGRIMEDVNLVSGGRFSSADRKRAPMLSQYFNIVRAFGHLS